VACRSDRDRVARRASVRHDWDTALDAVVVLATPELRASYVRMVAGMRALSDTDRARLAEQQRSDGEHFVELWVSMQTSRWEWNDLGSSHSLWTITLRDGEGRSLEAIERNQLPQKPIELGELFPGVSPFTLGWRVRFPTTFADGTPVLRADLRQLSARFAGPLGQSDVVWQSR
jgi:hypothetical protein